VAPPQSLIPHGYLIFLRLDMQYEITTLRTLQECITLNKAIYTTLRYEN